MKPVSWFQLTEKQKKQSVGSKLRPLVHCAAMAAIFSCRPCSALDPTKDTVRFDGAAMSDDKLGAVDVALEAQRLREEEAEQARLRTEAGLAEERRREEEACARREREAQQRRAEEEQRRREAERREAEERALAEERRRAQAERERAEAAEVEARKRTVEVTKFLKDNGFAKGTAGPKKFLMRTTYPLHAAAKSGNAAMVEMLLLEGAHPAQKNSAGKTAMEVAISANKQNSHAGVLRALASPAPQRQQAAGGA